MIKKYISEIQTKSDQHRRRVAYGTSAVVTLVIALIWISSFGSSGNSNNSNNTAANDTGRTKPLAVIGSNVSTAYYAFLSAVGVDTSTNADRQNATGTLEYVPEN